MFTHYIYIHDKSILRTTSHKHLDNSISQHLNPRSYVKGKYLKYNQ